MEYKFESIFYFGDDNLPISIDYKTKPLDMPFEIELLAFCLHVLRTLLNTSHSFYGQNLTHILTKKNSFIEYFITSSRFNIQPYEDNPTKKRIITKTIIHENKYPYFNMKIKGFGFFGEGPTIGCVNSVGMFINLLFDKYKNKEALLNVIMNACYLCAKSIMNKETKITNQDKSAIEISDRAIKESSIHMNHSLTESSETIIKKKDADYIFGLTKPEWENYTKIMVHPEEWEVRLAQHDTGTSVMSYDTSTGFGLLVQPLYNDDKSPPDMIIVGSYYPLGTIPSFDDQFIQNIENKSRTDLGPTYSVSANYVKTPPLEGVELIITRIKQ